MSDAKLIDALHAIVGERGVVTGADDLETYNVDWRHVFRGQARCAVLPRSTQEVAEVVRLCAGLGIAIVPFGGNTGLSGGATPDGSGRQVVISLARMSAIRDIDTLGETMEVEAGCILQTAQEAATEAGLMLPISLAAEGSARIGGILSTNAGGSNVLRYGMSRTRVLGLEVVTAQGEIVSGLRRLRKDNAGYDWKQWFIGAEGTLGIVTAAVLQLAPLSSHRVTALLAVPTPDAALKVLRAARRQIGETLNAFELMSGAALELVAKHQGVKAPLAASDWFVLVEASSCLPGLRDAVETLLGAVLEDGDATDGVIAESERQEGELWLLRESITEAESREGRSLKHDVSVPIARIPAFLQEADAAVADAFVGSRVNAFGHAGDGNIHYNVVVSPEADGRALNMLVHDLVVRHGGSISAEHGIGQYRVSELERCRAAPELDLARRIKRALDPAGTMNPGKVISS
ncbi:FAD-binding oxidoreductase [Variovorax sp. RHLX14]|uniref:FAD-binding oxidoreductase n=1 Tax=Variovorax sp. RHLX14 TaxID=1259731 RepID=UPI003F460D90